MKKKFLSIVLTIAISCLFIPQVQSASSLNKIQGLFRQDVHQIENKLKSEFPKINFEFSQEVHDWYKFLLFEVLTTLPKKHVSNLETISIVKLNVARRGMIAFYMNIATNNPRVKLKLNPIEFPLETGFSCDTVIQCMRTTNSYMNREFVGVAIHEIGHAIDFGQSTRGNSENGISTDFKNGPFTFFNDDPSVASFYPICYKTAHMLSRKKCNRYDFVSTYAKTDAFEDFAETMTVYVLDGENFYQKALKNQEKGFDPLMRKYEFFRDQIFDGKEFHLLRAKRRNLFTTNDATRRKFSLITFLYKY